MTQAIISYVNENFSEATRIAQYLKGKGISVLLDKSQLLPGMRWTDAIREEIREGSFFLACFSEHYCRRDKFHMNEELVLAIDELRSRPTNRTWFVPIVLKECDVPACAIGGGDTLLDLQWVNLHMNWENGLMRIVDTILNEQIEAAQNELCRLAKWLRKRQEYSSTYAAHHVDVNLHLILEAEGRYQEARSAFNERFGKDFHPLSEM